MQYQRRQKQARVRAAIDPATGKLRAGYRYVKGGGIKRVAAK